MNDQERNHTESEPRRGLKDGYVGVPRKVVTCLTDSRPWEAGKERSWCAKCNPQLMTDDIRQRLPELYSTRDVEDPVVQVRYRAWRVCDWNAIEFDGKDLFFGLIWQDFPVWGYFRLSDFESINMLRGRPTIAISRFFRPVSAGTAIADYCYEW